MSTKNQLRHFQQSTPSDTQQSSGSQNRYLTPEDDTAEAMDDFLEKLHLSPLKRSSHHKSKELKLSYAKKKFLSISETIQKKLKTVLHLHENERIDVNNVDYLMAQVKEKNQSTSSTNKKIQYLTLAPEEWPNTKKMNYFSVGRKLVEKAKHLRETLGILGEPKSLRRVDTPQEILDKVFYMYCDVDGINSRILPGMKDRVRISRDTYEQKRLLLCSLKELYTLYKEQYPTDKIGFSKFCTLRPKQCILAGSSGTHSICVCAEHQNFKLLLAAVKTKLTYKDVVSKITCDSSNPDCMYRTCPNCPKRNEIEKILEELLFPKDADIVSSEEDEDEEEDYYSYKEWTSTDRSELLTKRCSKSELLNLLTDKSISFLTHMYVTNQQSGYLKYVRKNLKTNEALILMDFAENYKYVVQDDIQARYWNQTAVTLHPVVIYINDGIQVNNINLCFFF